jgi:hypothetical protein
LEDLIKKVESRIDAYLGEMDQEDTQSEGARSAPSRQKLEEKVALLKERKGRYQEILGEMAESGETGDALTDADARMMKGAHGYLVGYNVQVAVDAKHDLIVAQEVVQAANDLNQLAPMAVMAKEELGVEKLQVVADKGYHDIDQLESCEKAGLETFVPEAARGGSGLGKGGKKIFPKELFSYEEALDAYRCPTGQTLKFQSFDTRHGQKCRLYMNQEACLKCALKTQCTTGVYRALTRRVNQAVAERAAKRVAERPELVTARKEIVEHVFGTLRNWTHDLFLLRGLAKVRGEFSLSAVAYNLRRVLNLVSMEELLKKVAV